MRCVQFFFVMLLVVSCLHGEQQGEVNISSVNGGQGGQSSKEQSLSQFFVNLNNQIKDYSAKIAATFNNFEKVQLIIQEARVRSALNAAFEFAKKTNEKDIQEISSNNSNDKNVSYLFEQAGDLFFNYAESFAKNLESGDESSKNYADNQTIVNNFHLLGDVAGEATFFYTLGMQVVEGKDHADRIENKLVKASKYSVDNYKKAITEATKKYNNSSMGRMNVLLGKAYCFVVPYLSKKYRKENLKQAWKAYLSATKQLPNFEQEGDVWVLLGDAYASYTDITMGFDSKSAQQNAFLAYKSALAKYSSVLNQNQPKNLIPISEKKAYALFKIASTLQGPEKTKYILEAITLEVNIASLYKQQNNFASAAKAYYEAAMQAFNFLHQQKEEWFSKASALYVKAASSSEKMEDKQHFSLLSTMSEAYAADNADKKSFDLNQLAQDWINLSRMYVDDPVKYIEAYKHAFDIYKGIMSSGDKIDPTIPPLAAACASTYAQILSSVMVMDDKYQFKLGNMYQLSGKWYKQIIDTQKPGSPQYIQAVRYGAQSFQKAAGVFYKLSVESTIYDNTFFLDQFGKRIGFQDVDLLVSTLFESSFESGNLNSLLIEYDPNNAKTWAVRAGTSYTMDPLWLEFNESKMERASIYTIGKILNFYNQYYANIKKYPNYKQSLLVGEYDLDAKSRDSYAQANLSFLVTNIGNTLSALSNKVDSLSTTKMNNPKLTVKDEIDLLNKIISWYQNTLTILNMPPIDNLLSVYQKLGVAYEKLGGIYANQIAKNKGAVGGADSPTDLATGAFTHAWNSYKKGGKTSVSDAARVKSFADNLQVYFLAQKGVSDIKLQDEMYQKKIFLAVKKEDFKTAIATCLDAVAALSDERSKVAYYRLAGDIERTAALKVKNEDKTAQAYLKDAITHYWAAFDIVSGFTSTHFQNTIPAEVEALAAELLILKACTEHSIQMSDSTYKTEIDQIKNAVPVYYGKALDKATTNEEKQKWSDAIKNIDMLIKNCPAPQLNGTFVQMDAIKTLKKAKF